MSFNLEIEKAAYDFRTKHGYSTSNPIRIKSLLLELKVLTISRDMDGPFSGMSLKIDEDRFMIVNSTHSQISTTQRYSHFDYEQARTKLEIL